MKPEQLIGFIGDKLDTSPDYPFSGDRESAVFRHRGNRKWFALLMRGIPRGKLGGRGLPGVYPAYHMNKEHWISVALDEADGEALCALVCMSYDLTFPKAKRGQGRDDGA